MSSQLNLRVSDQFAERLDREARRLGQPMSMVLEALGTPALERAEADALFEAEALTAWEEYQLTGKHVTAASLDTIFSKSLLKAKAVAQEGSP